MLAFVDNEDFRLFTYLRVKFYLVSGLGEIK